MKLQINQQIEIDVDPAERYQVTNVEAGPGEQHLFETAGKWWDALARARPGRLDELLDSICIAV